MKTHLVAIAVVAALGQSAATVSAQSSVTSDCRECTIGGYTQYVRPYSTFVYSDRVSPYPTGPCCRTIFGEMICDIKHHMSRVVHCETDVLGATEDGCCDSWEDGGPMDSVPRLRDLVPRPLGWGHLGFLDSLFGPLSWCGPCGYGTVTDYSVTDPLWEDFPAGDTSTAPVEPPPTPPADTPSTVDTALPFPPIAAPSPSRLRAAAVPPAHNGPKANVTRSQYTEPVGTGIAPRRLSPSVSRTSNRLDQRATAEGKPATTATSKPATPATSKPATTATSKSKAPATSKSKTPASTVEDTRRKNQVLRASARTRPIRFGDQFGKGGSSRFRGATFR